MPYLYFISTFLSLYFQGEQILKRFSVSADIHLDLGKEQQTISPILIYIDDLYGLGLDALNFYRNYSFRQMLPTYLPR